MVTLKVSNHDTEIGKAAAAMVRTIGTMTPKTRSLFIGFITGKSVVVSSETASLFEDALEAIEEFVDMENAQDWLIEAEADVMDATEPD